MRSYIKMDRILKMDKYTVLKELERALNFKKQKGTYIKTIKPDEVFDEEIINPTTELHKVKIKDKVIQVPIIKKLLEEPDKEELQKIKRMLENTTSERGRKILNQLLEQEQKLKEMADLESKKTVAIVGNRKDDKKDDEKEPEKRKERITLPRDVLEMYENIDNPDYEMRSLDEEYMGESEVELEFDEGDGLWTIGKPSKVSKPKTPSRSTGTPSVASTPSIPLDDEDKDFLKKMMRLSGIESTEVEEKEEDEIPIRLVDDRKEMKSRIKDISSKLKEASGEKDLEKYLKEAIALKDEIKRKNAEEKKKGNSEIYKSSSTSGLGKRIKNAKDKLINMWHEMAGEDVDIKEVSSKLMKVAGKEESEKYLKEYLKKYSGLAKTTKNTKETLGKAWEKMHDLEYEAGEDTKVRKVSAKLEKASTPEELEIYLREAMKIKKEVKASAKSEFGRRIKKAKERLVKMLIDMDN